MLLKSLRHPGLHASLAAPDSYRPGWTARDRPFWNAGGESVSHYWIARGERYREFSWPSLEPLASDYEQTGNRQRFEAVYHKRRQVLTTLVLAEAFEHQGRFIEPLLDAMSRICDEPTWVLPAHDKHTIDLFSAETGNMLAWVSYIFGEDQAFAQSAAAVRALDEVRVRVLDPYLTSDDYWWMALDGQQPGNWTTWCTSNCLGAVLLLEANTGRRAQGIEKACRSLDRFIAAYAGDGGCDEGPMYWNFAAGCLFDSLEMLAQASGGALTVFDDPVIRSLATYIAKVHVSGLHFVNFADSPPEVPVDAALMHRFGTSIGDPHLQALGAQLYRHLDKYDPEDTLRLKLYRTLATFAAGTALRAVPGPDVAPLDDYLPTLQVAVAREYQTAGRGLVLAAKGGHNDERHNHNDIGNVIVYLDGSPVIIDVGVKQYVKDSFTDRRYEIWAMQSGYHNVPLVNGCMQVPGAGAAGRGGRFAPSDSETTFGVDIAAAYPPEAGLVAWRRDCVLDRTTSTIRIADAFHFSRPDNSYEVRFMTACPPRVVQGEILLELDAQRTVVLRSSAQPGRVSLHEFVLKDGHLKLVWGDRIYQVRLCFEGAGPHGRCDTMLTVRAGAARSTATSDVLPEHSELH
jgi:hypothetical protein